MKYEKIYNLRTEEVDGTKKFFVCFQDVHGAIQEIEVLHEIYEALKDSLTKEQSLARKDRRWPARSDLTEYEIYEQAIHKPKSVEETVLENLFAESLSKAIAELPETQARRFRLYYGCGLTYEQIADAEGCTRFPVMRSVVRAEDKIREKLKNL